MKRPLLSLAIATCSFALMYVFVLMGNPRIPNINLCWHHLPELIGIYFIGVFARQVKLPFLVVFAVYIVVVAIEGITKGLPMFSAILGAPMLIGYCLEHKFGNG